MVGGAVVAWFRRGEDGSRARRRPVTRGHPGAPHPPHPPAPSRTPRTPRTSTHPPHQHAQANHAQLTLAGIAP